MKLLKKDFRNGVVKVEINSLDDVWHLSHVISKGDKVKSRDTRKIKINETKVVKKTVLVMISVEKVEFHKHASVLRVNGPVLEAPEEIPKGSYHSLSLEIGSVFEIHKLKWMEFEKGHLLEASKDKPSKVLVVALDRDEAGFALLKKYGYDYLGEISGEVEKKYKGQKGKGDFYLDVIKEISSYVERYGIEKVVLGSPAFWKDELLKKMPSDLKSKVTMATCNFSGRNGIDELLKRGEVRKVLSEERVAREIGFVEDLFTEISKDGLAAYGLKEVTKGVLLGAVEVFLVVDSFLYSNRDSVDSLMKKVEQSRGSVHVISSEHQGGKKLSGLGGIGAILRYKF